MCLTKLKGFSLFVAAFCYTGILTSQISINNTATADELAKSIMAPANIVVPGSVILNCPAGAYGSFTNGTSDGLGIENGIILTTGQTSVFEQDNTGGSSGTDNGITNFVDADLQAIESLATYDGCVIEFDIEPICEKLVLDYIWGSDEYPEFVNGGYNDAFGFFVSGPGITGTKNIATVPGTTTLVSIDNVNSTNNSAYYVDNTGGNKIEYDGYTKDLSAEVIVVPCETYHLKIVCADAGDGIYDSGVLIAVNNPPCPINNIAWQGIDINGIEGCQDINIDLTRTGVITDPLDVDFEISGSATDGTDYTFGLTSHSFVPNDSIDSFHIPVLTDASIEGLETITIIAKTFNCSAIFADTITLNINDGGVKIDTSTIPESCIGMCDGSATALGNGTAPFTYLWNDNSVTSTISDLCAGDYSVVVTDANGCIGYDTLTVISGANNADATISASQDTFCLNEAGIILTAATNGGVWSGNGITNTGEFDPSIAGIGTHEIKYEISGGCGDTATYSLHVNPLKDASINSGQTQLFCITETSYSFTTLITGGTWSGNSIHPTTGEFNPNLAGIGFHELIYSLPDPCGNKDTITVEVVNSKDPTISASISEFCENDPISTLTVATIGGVWSGNGISNTGDFDPTTANLGNNEIIYTITGLCGATDTINLIVNPVKDASISPNQKIKYCEDDSLFTYLSVNTGGTWSGDGITTNGEFNPNLVGVGFHKIYYSLSNPCGDIDSLEIEILPRKNPSISASQTVFCESDASITLTSVDAGGTWSGNGMHATLGDFEPATASSGVHAIIYTIVDFCGAADTIQLTVNPNQNAKILGSDTNVVCILDNTFDLTVEVDSGSWNNPNITQSGFIATADLVALGEGIHQLIYTLPDPCGDQDTVWLEITNQVLATIKPAGPYCEDDIAIQLTAANTGGTWSGNGINPTTGEFNPFQAGAGVHEIIYATPGNCGHIDTTFIEVIPYINPAITITDTLICDDFGDIGLTTLEDNGVWKVISGVASGLDTANQILNTGINGAETIAISYNFEGLCPTSDTLIIEIQNYPDPVFDSVSILCESWVPVELNPNSTGGLFTGNGISGVPQKFDPSAAGIGIHTITYTVGELCVSTSTRDIEVLPQQIATINPHPQICVSETNLILTSTSNGGDFTGNGVTDSIFDASITGAGTHTVYYEISGQCGDTASTIITVVNPIDATIIPPNPICEGFDTLQLETVNPGGTWSGSSITNTGLVNNQLGEGKYNVVYSFNSVCVSSDSIEFEILDVPNTDFVAGPRSGCIPLTVGFFDVSDSLAVNTYWDFGNGAGSTDVDTTSFTYFDDGCYDITLYNEYSNGCQDSLKKSDAVCAYPVPDADFAFSPNDPDITNQILELYNLSTPGVDYWWDMGPEALERFSAATNPLAIYSLFEEDTVAISLNVMNIHGCLDSIMKKVLIEDVPTLFVPNSFTPNGDARNDVFLPRTNGYKISSYTLLIYDRWGNLIFETNDYSKGWDGKVQHGASGQDAQIDVYVWKILFETEKTSNIPIEQIGTVTLIK